MVEACEKSASSPPTASIIEKKVCDSPSLALPLTQVAQVQQDRLTANESPSSLSALNVGTVQHGILLDQLAEEVRALKQSLKS